MLFERIESQGLAHYSYLIGDADQAVVIDPRRDGEIYTKLAYQAGLPITHIFETHRNEDYLIGSRELAERTGAQIWHADAELEYQYGQAVKDGQAFNIGGWTLKALHAPGHTMGMMNYVLHTPHGAPYAVFSGDTLFAGAVGRTDLFGMDRAEEMSGLLYDSIFGKLLPLGDHVILCPAHGSGSACGASIADRPWTTIGLERKLNPMLQHTDKSEFIEHAAVEMEFPPYFHRMERINLEGAAPLGAFSMPRPLMPEEFEGKADDAIVLDTRSEVAFGAAHVPGAIHIWAESVPSFAGWFLSYDQPLLLVAESHELEDVVRMLVRIGYDDLDGFLSGGMLSWHKAGKPSQQVNLVTVQSLCRQLDAEEPVHILDVRKDEELEQQGEIPGAQHIHITQLLRHIDEIPTDAPIEVFCGSGLRSMIGASLLQREGWEKPGVIMGGFAGWNSISCPIRR